jgi:hypothetical protein
LLPVAAGLRLAAVNIAVPASSSVSATEPAAQLLVGLLVVAENAEYEACQTTAAEAAMPATPASALTTRTDRVPGRTAKTLIVNTLPRFVPPRRPCL